MSYEISNFVDQKNRPQAAMSVLEAKVDEATDLYSYGEFDGKIGDNPTQPEHIVYWQGYCKGLRQYWLKRQDKSWPTKF